MDKKVCLVNIRMTKNQLESLEKHCNLTGQSKTTAILRALDFYINHYKEFLETHDNSEKH